MKIKVMIVFLVVASTISAQEVDTLRIKRLENRKSEMIVDSLQPRSELESGDSSIPLPYDKKKNSLLSRFNEKYLFDLKLNGEIWKDNICHAPYSKYIIPASLITYGVSSLFDKTDDYEIHDEVMKNNIGRYRIDDYTQFAPAVTVYGLDLLGIKAKHDIRDRIIIMATSHIIMGGIVQTMKSTINVQRPDGSNYNSFPSGHTATAFVGAHILFKEYKEISPWIGVSGYAVAAGTGLLRVTNRKHWLSDVSAGAGIGILSAELGYLLLPVVHKALGIKEESKLSTLVVAPTIGLNNWGLGMAYTF
ncbi:MAG: phosphatase PAP2 family protein [Clostridia bacterium]|nr:phosphatase PAP2 family protein [Clostridia bacterium]